MRRYFCWERGRKGRWENLTVIGPEDSAYDVRATLPNAVTCSDIAAAPSRGFKPQYRAFI